MSSYNRVKEAAAEADRYLEEKTEKVEKLWACLSVGGMGGEGIVAYTLPDIGTVPMVTGSETNMAMMAKALRDQGTNFRVVEFSVRKDVTEDFN